MEDDRQGLLERLTALVEERAAEAGEDRRSFFEALQHLQQGQVEEASKKFRRAARRCEGPFQWMATLAQARCEVVRGRQGVALRLFDGVATSTEAPPSLRKMACMELADLARDRSDQALFERAESLLPSTYAPP